MSERFDVCAAVIGDLSMDARVWKEVNSLAKAGMRVRLIGCRYDINAVRARQDGGVSIVEIPLGTRAGQISLRARANALICLWREILRTKASVYHAHNIHTAPAAWLASRMRHAKLVYDGHELYGDRKPGSGVKGFAAATLGRILERFIVRTCDVAITTNASRAVVLADRHGRRDVEVIANVPVTVFDLHPIDPGFPDAPVLLYQGGIYAQQRAFRETIQALVLVPNLHFVVLGFGRERDLGMIRSWAAEIGVHDRVHILPPRPFNELVLTAAGATIGLVPIKPLGTNEFLGDTNKLYEYLMAGLPIVASNLPEISRVVTSGRLPVGEVFDPDSPRDIAHAIERILADPTRYEARRHEARRLALEQYNWGLESTRLLMIYSRLFAEPVSIKTVSETR